MNNPWLMVQQLQALRVPQDERAKALEDKAKIRLPGDLYAIKRLKLAYLTPEGKTTTTATTTTTERTASRIEAAPFGLEDVMDNLMAISEHSENLWKKFGFFDQRRKRDLDLDFRPRNATLSSVSDDLRWLEEDAAIVAMVYIDSYLRILSESDPSCVVSHFCQAAKASAEIGNSDKNQVS